MSATCFDVESVLRAWFARCGTGFHSNKFRLVVVQCMGARGRRMARASLESQRVISTTRVLSSCRCLESRCSSPKPIALPSSAPQSPKHSQRNVSGTVQGGGAVLSVFCGAGWVDPSDGGSIRHMQSATQRGRENVQMLSTIGNKSFACIMPLNTGQCTLHFGITPTLTLANALVLNTYLQNFKHMCKDRH